MNIPMRHRQVPYLLLIFIAVMVAMAAGVPAGAEAQQPVAPLFVSASVDNDRPYVGQQVTYVFRIHQRSDAATSDGTVEYRHPAFSGFWNSGLNEQLEYSETTPSGSYRVVELRTPLFPSVADSITIEPGSLTLSGIDSQPAEILESSPVTIEAQPLPPDPPVGFSGAVGRFDLSIVPEVKSEQEAGAVHLVVTIEGEGNIGALPDPNWPDFANWRVIESPEVSDSRIVDGLLMGRRIYTLTLLPTNSGDLVIPQVSFTYFDPYAENYNHVSTTPITVSIAGGGLPEIAADSGAASATRDGVNAGAMPIKAPPDSLRREGFRLTSGAAYWVAWVVPLLAIVAALVWKHRRTALENARTNSHRRNALPNARREMERAISGGTDARIASADALLSYLAVRLDASVTRLTREELIDRLLQAMVSPDITRGVEGILTAGEEARYSHAPVSPTSGKDYGEHAALLMADIEEVLGV